MTHEERNIIAEWVRPMLEAQAQQVGLLEARHDPTAPQASCEDPTESPSIPDDELDNDLNTYLQSTGQ